MDDVVTVEYLRKIFNKLSEKGYGDMKVKCMNKYLHQDDLWIYYLEKEVVIKRAAYNDIENAMNDNECKLKSYELKCAQNAITIICFTVLSVIFGHWWIILASLLFFI